MRQLILSMVLVLVSGLWSSASAQESNRLWQSHIAENGGAMKATFVERGLADEERVSVEILADAAFRRQIENPTSVPFPLDSAFIGPLTETFIRKNGIDPQAIDESGTITWDYFGQIGRANQGYIRFTDDEIGAAYESAYSNSQSTPEIDTMMSTTGILTGGPIQPRQVTQTVETVVRPDPALTAALSAAQQRIQTLETRLETLERQPTELPDNRLCLWGEEFAAADNFLSDLLRDRYASKHEPSGQVWVHVQALLTAEVGNQLGAIPIEGYYRQFIDINGLSRDVRNESWIDFQRLVAVASRDEQGCLRAPNVSVYRTALSGRSY